MATSNSVDHRNRPSAAAQALGGRETSENVHPREIHQSLAVASACLVQVTDTGETIGQLLFTENGRFTAQQ